MIPVERFDLNGRWYAPLETWWEENGKGERPFRRSSTTILDVIYKGIGYDKWLGNSHGYASAMDYANARARIGTIVHEIIDQLHKGLLLGEPLEINPEDKWYDADNDEVVEITREIQEYIESYIMFYNEHKPEILFSEVSMFNPDLAWAGTADIVCIIDGERWLIDLKTGHKYPVHCEQLTSYKILWDSLTEEPIDKIGCLYLKSGFTERTRTYYELKRYGFVPEQWDMTVKKDQFYNKTKPKFPIELPKSIKLERKEDEPDSNKEDR